MQALKLFSTLDFRLQVSEISVCTLNARNFNLGRHALDDSDSHHYRQRLGRHALNDHHGQSHLSAMQMSPHAGQRLCTGDLGSKSHDCFFHAFIL